MTSGGEIFVPKIPSTTITDLASLICPKLGQETVGLDKLRLGLAPAVDLAIDAVEVAHLVGI